MRLAVALLVTLCSLACSRSAVRLPDDPAAALAWLPPDVLLVMQQGSGHVSILEYLRSTLGDRRPACVDRVARDVDHAFMLSRSLGDRSVNAWHGIRDRDDAERCAVEVWKLLAGGETLQVEHDGAVTVLRGTHGMLVLAWSSDGWVYHDRDRSRVEAMLRRGGPPTLAPELRPLLARVDRRDALWTVFAGDALGLFVGVKSSAFVQRSPQLPTTGLAQHLPVTFIFPAPGDAEHARDAIRRAESDEALSAPLRRVLAKLAPNVANDELELDVQPLFTDREAMQAALDWMKAAAACRAGTANACPPRATEAAHSLLRSPDLSSPAAPE